MIDKLEDETVIITYYKQKPNNNNAATILEKEDILDPKILMAKIQRQNLYQVGKVNFGGSRIELCPENWDNNSNTIRKKVFYRRAVKDNYKSKPLTKEGRLTVQSKNR